jgi:lipopolysaccharide transport system permease protein
MTANLVKLYQYRELLWIWIYREIKIRYKQSVLGTIWAILQPLSMMLIFTLVFSFLARLPSDGVPYPIFSYSALLPWTFFATAVSFGSTSLINNLNLVTKTYFPREILPLGSIGAGFFDFLIASTIFLFMMLFYRIPVTRMVLWIPVILLIQVLFSIGITLLLSALTVYYRDLRFVIPLGMQLWMFATPVIYSTSLVPEGFLPLYMLNPMAGIIESYRNVLLFGKPPVFAYLGLAAFVSVMLCFVGYKTFKKLEKTIPDII